MESARPLLEFASTMMSTQESPSSSATRLLYASSNSALSNGRLPVHLKVCVMRSLLRHVSPGCRGGWEGGGGVGGGVAGGGLAGGGVAGGGRKGCGAIKTGDTLASQEKNLVVVGEQILPGPVPPFSLDSFMERTCNSAFTMADHVTPGWSSTDTQPPQSIARKKAVHCAPVAFWHGPPPLPRSEKVKEAFEQQPTIGPGSISVPSPAQS